MSILQDLQLENVIKRPQVRVGDTVKVHQRVKEGEKERVQIFEGLVIKMNSGFGPDKTITVRKVVEGIGVEKIFPLHLPKIEKIEIKKKSKIRRAKLYYMRDRSGKSARLKETFVSSADVEKEAEREAAIEELAAQKAKEAVERGEAVEELTTSEVTKIEDTSAAENSQVNEDTTEQK